jgi:uncharacterized membrane protein
VVLALSVATIVALVLLWPGDVDRKLGQGLTAPSERAQVDRIRSFPCSGFQTDQCRDVIVRLETGPDEGARSTIRLGAGGLDPDLSVGDEVRVTKGQAAPGTEPIYTLSDFERRTPMLLLVGLFALCVIAFGRLRGALSLVGLALSLFVVVAFVAPAILDGKEPVVVAVVGSMAVMISTITLAHGVGAKSLAAILGTAGSLLLTVALAVLFTDLTHLTGLASEEATVLQLNGTGVELKGLLIAGMVIAALGVLDDVTISQSAIVLALKGANPELGFRDLVARALDVGRDHVSATVNTLVLAYAGSSLPLLLVFTSGQLGFLDAANIELVAAEIVATLVGSLGLIAAVPITTALAALISSGLPAGELAAAGGHRH